MLHLFVSARILARTHRLGPLVLCLGLAACGGTQSYTKQLEDAASWSATIQFATEAFLAEHSPARYTARTLQIASQSLQPVTQSLQQTSGDSASVAITLINALANRADSLSRLARNEQRNAVQSQFAPLRFETDRLRALADQAKAAEEQQKEKSP
jgi:hypothetical protein